MSRHSMIAMLGPEILAQQLAELRRLAVEADAEILTPADIRRRETPPAPQEPIMLSGRPGTNRHARRARAAMARRNK